MNARELHDYFNTTQTTFIPDGARPLIIRALSLLASVEESKDGLVKRLTASFCESFPDSECAATGMCECRDHATAAAALVHSREECARKDALLNKVRELWPEIRQLHDGFMASDPSAWTEWDQSVREKTIELSFALNGAHPKE